MFDGDAVNAPDGIRIDALRRQVQMVFQDSYASLNPRMPIRDSVAFGPFIQGKKRPEVAFHPNSTAHFRSAAVEIAAPA